MEKIALSHLFGKSVAEGGGSTLLGARRSLCEDDTKKMQARECDTREGVREERYRLAVLTGIFKDLRSVVERIQPNQ